MRVELAGVGDADDHAELLLHIRLRRRRFHAAEFERRTFVFVEIGQDGGGLHGLRSGTSSAPRPHHAGRLRHRRAVLRHQRLATPL